MIFVISNERCYKKVISMINGLEFGIGLWSEEKKLLYIEPTYFATLFPSLNTRWKNWINNRYRFLVKNRLKYSKKRYGQRLAVRRILSIPRVLMRRQTWADF